MPRAAFGRDFPFLERAQLLTFEEITRIARVAAAHGVSKLRLTGGEPLLRRDLPRLVAMLAAIDGIDDLALTTNGALLARAAPALAQAGLRRVTVSLDSLDERVFHQMSDSRVPLARVLEGLDAATTAGLSPVKVNMVVRRGVNDHCVTAMAEHFRGRPQTLRLIEYMDVGETNGWRRGEVVPAREMLASIDRRWPLEPLAPTAAGEVASRYAYRDGAGEIGVISSVSEPFCTGCTRARLSAEGRLYTCLFANAGHDLRELLRGGADDEQLTQRLEAIWTGRADRYSQRRAEREPSVAGDRRGPGSRVKVTQRRVEMSYIGG
jgi:cyclic pyranopterin phosphate synthase